MGGIKGKTAPVRTPAALGLPLTTKLKRGSWYAPISFAGAKQIIVLAQGRVLDYRRLKEKMGELEENEAFGVRRAYLSLHKALETV